jgi:hypothetical protein
MANDKVTMEGGEILHEDEEIDESYVESIQASIDDCAEEILSMLCQMNPT